MKRNQRVNDYYKCNGIQEQFEPDLDKPVTADSCSEFNDKNDGESIASDVQKAGAIAIEEIFSDYETWLATPLSGRSRLSESTKNNDILSLKKVIQLGDINNVNELVEYKCIEHIVEQVEKHRVQDGSKYVYIGAVSKFLDFCNARQLFSTDVLSGQSKNSLGECKTRF